MYLSLRPRGCRRRRCRWRCRHRRQRDRLRCCSGRSEDRPRLGQRSGGSSVRVVYPSDAVLHKQREQHPYAGVGVGWPVLHANILTILRPAFRPTVKNHAHREIDPRTRTRTHTHP